MTSKASQFLLSESMVDTVAVYMILQRMLKPFEEWDACKFGIIDKDGKKLKEPVTSKEREAWDILTKFVWNFKKILQRFLGKSKFITYISAAYLLKDSIGPYYFQKNLARLDEELADFSFRKQLHIHDVCRRMPPLSEKLTEANFEMLMFQYMPLFEALENEIDKSQFIG